MALEVFKTEKEKFLNKAYMCMLKSDTLITEADINSFKKQCEEIRKENPLYNKNIN